NNDLTSVNLKASAGMYNNFASIPFYTKNNYDNLSNKYNIGWYNAVTKNGTRVEENTNGGNLFLTGNADKVRMLTLPEINKERGQEAQNINSTGTINTEPAPGLFKLNNLLNAGLTGYTYSSDWYWLASPYYSEASRVYCVDFNGLVGSSYSNTFGVRPIVSLGSDISYKVERESENGFSYLVLSEVSAE
ncbi:MAG: DUF6273 domain-containing protein, partial [Clostridia bacterium]|nr:DUF6273 domain-containing protein [Clostridia bacterium]